jgi:hypothetical protein
MSLVRTLTDDSGKIEVGVFQDQVPTAASKHELDIDVDEDMIAVGGGGIGSRDPGALLTASRPTDGLRGWRVASTDHSAQDEHRLEGFALGLKIAGMSRSKLLANIRMVSARRGAVHHPEISAQLPGFVSEEERGFLLISGGFEVLPNDDANLATASYPEFERGWRSASKDHVTPALAGIDSYVIGIQPVLPVGRIVVETVSAESRFSDRPVANAELNPAFALTGIGALVRWTEPGCLIWKLTPLLQNAAGADVQGVDAAAKDHLESSRATMQVWALGIRLQEDPCL